MATFLKDPPNFVTNIGAWEYTLAKLENKQAEDGKQRLDEGGNPLNYAGAVAIYKNVVKKYPAFRTDNRAFDRKPLNKDDVNIDTLFERYPVGQMFWYDDVLCEAVVYQGGQAVYPNSIGTLFIRGKILDVDAEGKHKNWPVGKVNGFPPHRCSDLMEA